MTRKSTSHKVFSRRRFLQYGATAASGLWIVSKSSGAEFQSPNDKLNVAFIGIGGQGRANLNPIGKTENVVALCDVDDDRAGDAYEKFPQAKKFFDYRKMLEEMDSQIDAVAVSTPDHMHYHPSMMAMRMNKHLYCEKPMAHAVSEVQAMTKLAREKGLATQLGMQRHAMNNMHRVVDIVRSGAIGEVREVYSWLGGNRGMPDKPTEFPPVPAHLKWDLWLGCATAVRDYSPAFCPYNWRFWWDYGTGETGNWGCHILDIPFWALQLEMPIKVSARGPEVDPERSPKSLFAQYEFPTRGDLPPVTLHWYHTDQPIPFFKEHNIPQSGNNLFVGSKGMLLCGFDKFKLYPEEKFADFKEPQPTIPKSPGFHMEWIKACKGGEKATCNFEYSGPLAETVLLGNLAYRIGQSFEWDTAATKAVGCPQADALIFPEYRKGWEI